MKKFTPICENVLAEIDSVTVTDSGLETPSAIENTGTVISVGQGTPDWPEMYCKPGDKIKWHRNSGERVEVEGKPCIILNERKREIQGKIQ